MSHTLPTVLLDTDYAINFLRGLPEARDIIIPLWQENSAFLSLLSVYELYAGMRAKEKRETDNFINACRIVPITIELTKKAGEYRYKYQQRGIILSIVDCFIAETARLSAQRIATNNKKHYPESLFYPVK